MRKIAAWIVFAAIALGVVASARAQDSGEMRWKSLTEESSASADEVILGALEKAKKTGEGLVIVGGGFERLGCLGIEVIVRRRFEPKAENVTIPAVGMFLGSVRNFTPKGLVADTWMIAAIKCSTGRSAQIFYGPYASFDVRPGEIVDAGFLTIDYEGDENLLKRMFTGSATIRLSIGATPELRLAELRKRIPRVMALVKKQPMELLGPAEQKVKFKNSIF